MVKHTPLSSSPLLPRVSDRSLPSLSAYICHAAASFSDVNFSGKRITRVVLLMDHDLKQKKKLSVTKLNFYLVGAAD